jgi:hypothetical protein
MARTSKKGTFGEHPHAAPGRLPRAKQPQCAEEASFEQAGAGTIAAFPVRTPSYEQIAERAKAIWRAKGCVSGQDEQNWREAESELKTELGIS